MDNHVTLDAYEAPAILGSFEAQDVIGAADGGISCGSFQCA